MGFLEDQEFWALSQCFSGTDFAISASQNNTNKDWIWSMTGAYLKPCEIT